MNLAWPKKILIVGLPRTGTTSLCNEFLQLGYKVAHTAYTQAAMLEADVIADTPVFSDFAQLSPRLKVGCWVYLHRQPDQWAKSFLRLREKIMAKPQSSFPRVFWQSWEHVFGPRDALINLTKEQLIAIYHRHQDTVLSAANQQKVILHQWRLGKGAELTDVLNGNFNTSNPITTVSTQSHLNRNAAVFAWGRIKHSNKIASNLSGEHGRKYFDLSQ